MRVLLTGASGTIGRAIAAGLHGRGDEVVALSRDTERARATLGAHAGRVYDWAEPTAQPPAPEALAGADAVVHMLGEPIAQRWSPEARQAIRESRVLGTRMLIRGIEQLEPASRPPTLISQSAAGYYGAHGEEPLDESAAAGSDFLAGVVNEWEAEARAAPQSTRVVLSRTGVVLSSRGGALATMLPFFRLGLGGPVAGGRQYIPWVHLADIVAATLFCLDDEQVSGPLNFTAPNPVTNAEFSKALGRALGRPAVLPVPAFGLRLLYGEMSQVVATGARVVPKRLSELGFEFRHPEIDAALRDVLQNT